ncbi:MAG TPA: ABC transporter permease [Gemmatimonadaceae bacterium]|nr:ABC transporter permease [Gemmatimonadaceae bacterium]
MRQDRHFRLDTGPHRVTRDVDEEIEFHLAMRIAKLVAAGMDPVAARAEALRQFGDTSAVRAECLTIDRERERTMRRANRMSDLWQDASYTFRTMRHHTSVVAIMIAILALGIGANTAMFTLIDAIMLRPLNVAHPDQLVTIGDPRRVGSMSQGTPNPSLASVPVYEDLRDQQRVFSGLYANGRVLLLNATIPHHGASAPTGAGADDEHPSARYVSGNFFKVLGVPPFLGRTFADDEDKTPGDDPVVVVSYAYWQNRFGGDRSAVGSTITLNGTPMTIIGVAPKDFWGDIVGSRPNLWVPLMMQPVLDPHEAVLKDRTISWLQLMGRLEPGVSLEQARAQITTIYTRTLIDHAGKDLSGIERAMKKRPILVEAGARGFSYYRASLASFLYTLMAAVGLVLLVVCANVANLMLSRAAARGREMSVRMALGAGRGRLLQQLLTESAIIAVIGGALGLLVAYWGSQTLLKLAGGGPRPIPIDVRPDGRILAFTAAVALVTALLFGLAPALRATRIQLASALRAQGRNLVGAGSRRFFSAGKMLVVAQVALSLLLLVATGLLVRTTIGLLNADVGIARDQLVIARVEAGRAGYADARLVALMRDLIQRTSQVAGVTSASLSENGIFSGTESGTGVEPDGFTAHADSDTIVAYDDVGPGYFATTGAHLLRGRDIEARDNETAPKVAVVNQTMANYYYPTGDAVGHHLTVGTSSLEIVGVVSDIQDHDVRAPPTRRFYMATFQLGCGPGADTSCVSGYPAQFYLEIRSRAGVDPARLVEPVRRAITSADPSLAVLSVDPLTDNISSSISAELLVAKVVSAFGILALVLASLGLYGVMAYATVRRTAEFGLRMALGAQSAEMTRMVLRESMLLVIAGAVIGIPAALAAAPLLKTLLYGVSAFDPSSIAIAVGAMALTAAVAAALPAIRASRVSPMEALREE